MVQHQVRSRRCDCGNQIARARRCDRAASQIFPGDRVRILQVPFTGHLGLYAGMQLHERVLVLLALQRVELAKGDVETVGPLKRSLGVTAVLPRRHLFKLTHWRN